jgi:hypothetical protein
MTTTLDVLMLATNDDRVIGDMFVTPGIVIYGVINGITIHRFTHTILFGIFNVRLGDCVSISITEKSIGHLGPPTKEIFIRQTAAACR